MPISLQLPYDPNNLPATLPVILSGPILRRLTRAEVTVWAALSRSDLVTLRVRSKATANARDITEAPVRIGRHVYLVALTVGGVDGPGGDEFVEGNVYEYWLESPGWPVDPTLAPNWASFTVPGEILPTFLGLPGNMEDLVVFHSSCRRAKGDRRDGFGQAYRLLVADPAQRPHAMILSGDQIYADEVACTHMLLLRQLNQDLIQIDEYGDFANGPKIFALSSAEHPVIPGAFEPKIGGRSDRNPEFGFSIRGSKDHLWTLAEFYGTYLTVWSDALWPTQLPDFDPNEPGLIHYRNPEQGIIRGTDEDYWRWENNNLSNFLETMGGVRRALANVPTYMLFDDHEATDDWNLDYSWVKDVYASPQGTRVITNALLSYLLFQHWGNAPAPFQVANPPQSAVTPESKALAAATWQNSPDYHPVDRAATLFNDPNALGDLLGVPRDVPAPGVFPTQDGYDMRSNLDPAQVVRYDFRLDATAHGYPCHLVFLDERTARHLGGTSVKVRAGRIGEGPLDLMWPSPQGSQADAPTILVAPAPVLGLHVVEHMLQPLLATVEEEGERKREYEGWAAYTPTFEHLLQRIGEWKRVIILSGDVHFGYSHKISYSRSASGLAATPVKSLQPLPPVPMLAIPSRLLAP